MIRSVPDSKSRNIPEVVIVRRWAVRVLGIWKGWDSWVKGGQMGSVYKQPETEVDDSYHSRSVRDGHGGGWSRKINAWHLYTLMVYL